MALNLLINSLCTHADDRCGGGRKEKDFRLQQEQHFVTCFRWCERQFPGFWTQEEYFLFHSWCAWLPSAKTCFKSIHETRLSLHNFLTPRWKKGTWVHFWEWQTPTVLTIVMRSTALWPPPSSKPTFSLEYPPKLSLIALWRTQELDEICFSLYSSISLLASPALLLVLHPVSYTLARSHLGTWIRSWHSSALRSRTDLLQVVRMMGIRKAFYSSVALCLL